MLRGFSEIGAGDLRRLGLVWSGCVRLCNEADLDIVSGSVAVSDGVMRLTLRMAGRIKDNVIYSAWFYCGDPITQLAVKRAGAATDAFVFDFVDSTNTYVEGGIKGREAEAIAAMEVLGCSTGQIRFEAYAEGTSGRTPNTDRAPQDGKLRLSG